MKLKALKTQVIGAFSQDGVCVWLDANISIIMMQHHAQFHLVLRFPTSNTSMTKKVVCALCVTGVCAMCMCENHNVEGRENTYTF